MKVIRTLVVLDRGNIIDSAEWEKIYQAYTDAIRAMVHPPGSKQFTIRIKISKIEQVRQTHKSVEPQRCNCYQTAFFR